MYFTKPLNLVLVGDQNVGKSTLVAKCHEFNPTSSPGGYFTKDFVLPNKTTSIECYPTSIYLTGKEGQLIYSVFRTNIIDTGGAMRYNNIRPLAYKDADVFLICFDMTNHTSFDNVSRWVADIRKYEHRQPIILVATKSDLKHKREVGEEEARILARFLNFNDGIYVEVSYKDQTAVQTVFSTAVQSAYFGHRVKSKKHTRLLEPEKEIYDVTNLEQPSYPPDFPKDPSTLSKDWEVILQSKIATDVIIKCQDDPQDIHAHKFVLSLASKAFQELFHGSVDLNHNRSVDDTNICTENSTEESPFIGTYCTECQNSQGCTMHKICIKLKTIKRKTFLHLLNWMYTGSTGFDEDSNNSLDLRIKIQKAARILEVQSLCGPAIPVKPLHQSSVSSGFQVIPESPPLLPGHSCVNSDNELVQATATLTPKPLLQVVPLPPPPPPIPFPRGNNQRVPPTLLPSAMVSNEVVPAAPPPPPIPFARGSNQAVPQLPPVRINRQEAPPPTRGINNQVVPPPPPPPPPIGINNQVVLPVVIPPPSIPFARGNNQVVPPSARINNHEVPPPPPPPPVPFARGSDQVVGPPPPLPPIDYYQVVPLPAPPPPPPPPQLPIIPYDVIPPPPPLPPIPCVLRRRGIPAPPLRLPPLLKSARGPPGKKIVVVPPPSHLDSYHVMWREGSPLSCCPTDQVFIIEETPVTVHRIVLISRSPVMATMLGGSFIEKDQQQIKLSGVSLEDFRTVLDFLYTDNCSLDNSNIYSVLELAGRFMITSLVQRCEGYIIKRLEKTDEKYIVELVMDALRCSEAFFATNLYKWCLHFIATNYELFENEEKEKFTKIWKENIEYMEDNMWPPKQHMRVLSDYKFKARMKMITKPRRNTTKCRCCIM